MTLENIVELVNKSLGIKLDDMASQSIVKNSINEAYVMLSNIDKRLTRAYIPIINGIMTIPTDSIGIVKSKPQLDITDRVYGNSIVTDKTGTLELLYYTAREPLANDTDEFDLATQLQMALVNYSCFLYMLTKGEINIANQFYVAYERNISQYEVNDLAVPETIVEVEY